jgi:SAM-dependent methyltransferase
MILYSPYFIIKTLQREKFKKFSLYLKGKILDLGCGIKPYKNYLVKNSQYVGMDETIEVWPDTVGQVDEIPFADEQFDSVLCTEVLEHLPEPEKAIKEIKRVLKIGGFLYLTVPQEWCLHYEPADYFRFTKYGIKYLLEKNGFRITAIEKIGGILSLIGQRIVDVYWQFTVDCLRHIFGLKWAERFASLLIFPVSIFFYCVAKIIDKINEKDALGWAVLAAK